MEDLKRYWIGHGHWEDFPAPDAEECIDGDWCKADEALAIIDALKKRIAFLEAPLLTVIDIEGPMTEKWE